MSDEVAADPAEKATLEQSRQHRMQWAQRACAGEPDIVPLREDSFLADISTAERIRQEQMELQEQISRRLKLERERDADIIKKLLEPLPPDWKPAAVQALPEPIYDSYNERREQIKYERAHFADLLTEKLEKVRQEREEQESLRGAQRPFLIAEQRVRGGQMSVVEYSPSPPKLPESAVEEEPKPSEDEDVAELEGARIERQGVVSEEGHGQ